MDLKKLSPEELELMSYNDLTLEILKASKKPLNTALIFRQICDLLGYSDDDYANKIGDYYTLLTTDKRFILLDSNEWDVRDNHSVNLMDMDDDTLESEESEEIDEMEEDDYDDGDEVDVDIDIDDIDSSDIDEDIEDLAVIDEDELEEN